MAWVPHVILFITLPSVPLWYLILRSTGPEWTQFTPENKVRADMLVESFSLRNCRQAVIQLNGANLTMIPDDFRAGKHPTI